MNMAMTNEEMKTLILTHISNEARRYQELTGEIKVVEEGIYQATLACILNLTSQDDHHIQIAKHHDQEIKEEEDKGEDKKEEKAEAKK